MFHFIFFYSRQPVFDDNLNHTTSHVLHPDHFVLSWQCCLLSNMPCNNAKCFQTNKHTIIFPFSPSINWFSTFGVQCGLILDLICLLVVITRSLKGIFLSFAKPTYSQKPCIIISITRCKKASTRAMKPTTITGMYLKIKAIQVVQLSSLTSKDIL